MNTCEYLARIGFDLLLGVATPVEDEDDPESIEAARLAEHARVREILLTAPVYPITGRDGATYINRITWPDRVPGLATWSGQQSLPKIIEKLKKMVASSDHPDLFTMQVMGQGATGFDSLSCPDAIDVGFSLNKLGMAIMQRPALELLAIVGLESLPIVSFAPRECGFIHDGETYRFPIEEREGGYYYRWGNLVSA